jgi:TM2 domain-containing membrane protein YozV
MEKQLNQKWLIALLLCLFLGSLGVHRFYVGQTKTGVTMLLLVLLGSWIFGLGAIVAWIWAIIDLINIIIGKFTDGAGNVIPMQV